MFRRKTWAHHDANNKTEEKSNSNKVNAPRVRKYMGYSPKENSENVGPT